MTGTAILIGIAGGLAAAAMFLATLGGSVLGLPLLALSPLPIALLALGWGPLVGLVGVGAGALGVGGLTASIGTEMAGSLGGEVAVGSAGLVAAIGFLLVLAGPMLLYARLALLFRRRDPSDPGVGVDWYPLERLLLAVAAVTAVTLILAGLLAGFSVEAYAPALAELLATAVATAGLGPYTDAELLDAARQTLELVPITAGLGWTLVMAANLGLGAAITARSGRLRRPRPDVAAELDMPFAGAVVLAIAMLTAAFLGSLAPAAHVVTGAFTMAFAMVGFAVLHLLTRRRPGRPLILAAAYAITMLAWAAIYVAAALGILEGFLRLRRRAAAPGRV